MRTYQIETHPALDYRTGHNCEGDALLIGLRYPSLVAVLFNQEKEFAEARIRPLETEAPRSHTDGSSITEDTIFQLSVNAIINDWCNELKFSEGHIEIKQFFIPELIIGIDNLPRHLYAFLQNPTDFSREEQMNYPQLVEEWQSNSNFVLWWGKDYYLNKTGETI